MELRRMDAKSVEVSLNLYLKQMRERLEQAARGRSQEARPHARIRERGWRPRLSHRHRQNHQAEGQGRGCRPSGGVAMLQRSVDPTAIEAEVDHIRSLGIDALRKRWRLMFEKTPPAGLTKDIMARMIAYRIQEEAFGGLDRATIQHLHRLARGEEPNERSRPP